jgi:hypothetical protein
MATQRMNNQVVALIKNITADYTVSDELDLNYTLRVSGVVTVTLPNGFPEGFALTVENIAASTVTLSATGTLNSIGNLLATQWTKADLLVTVLNDDGTNEWDAIGTLTS